MPQVLFPNPFPPKRTVRPIRTTLAGKLSAQWETFYGPIPSPVWSVSNGRESRLIGVYGTDTPANIVALVASLDGGNGLTWDWAGRTGEFVRITLPIRLGRMVFPIEITTAYTGKIAGLLGLAAND